MADTRIRWDGYSSSRLSDLWQVPDFDDPAVREAAQSGLIERFADNGWRMFVRDPGGNGTVDRVRVREGVEVSVVNCVLPGRDRMVYEADESLILLYASLACDMAYRVEGQPPITIKGPELTLIYVPRGLTLVLDIEGGVRQQRLFGLFRHAALSKAFGLRSQQMPQVLRDAEAEAAPFGRLVSLPLDHHVATLVADTIDTPLHGEMRALQYQGRLTELVAYALEALSNARPESGGRRVLRSARELDIAERARARLSKEYRKPPNLDDLAHALATNPSKLRASFKAAFGVTMAEYCLDRRMREAQQLLLQGRLTISQVAEQVGYDYPSGFAAAFSAHVGVTPREYRDKRAPISVRLGNAAGD